MSVKYTVVVVGHLSFDKDTCWCNSKPKYSTIVLGTSVFYDVNRNDKYLFVLKKHLIVKVNSPS